MSLTSEPIDSITIELGNQDSDKQTTMIASNGLKRKSSSSSSSAESNHLPTTITKRFRGPVHDGATSPHHEPSSSSTKHLNKMTVNHNQQEMMAEYRQLQYELQCQEALLVLMQKLKVNQRITPQTNHLKQRTTTPAPPVNPAKLTSTTPTKQQQTTIVPNRSTATKPPHPNQYTVNRANNNSQSQSTKLSVPLPQATRQSNNSTLPATATRLSSTVPSKTSSGPATPVPPSKNNGINTDEHLLSAKLALRKQLEQTLLQIPTPKPTTCDLPYIPGINGWAEFLTLIGLEQAFSTCTDSLHRRLTSDMSMTSPNICAQCGTDWSVTWHEVSSNNEDEKIFCDRCRKTSQKKILKQDHSNRLRQAFMKALQQEKELDAKFQQQSPLPAPPVISKQPSSSSSHTKHQSTKPLSTKTTSHHPSSKHTNNHPHHHHHRHSSKTTSSKHTNPMDAFASTLAALPTNEQIELFQKHFLSNMNMFPFVANQAAALAAKSTQQQQQALAASMAASLMRPENPAQYLLDMIPQAAKHQQQQHHRHSK